jgi:PBSX family phage terminase large subunit
LFSAVLVDILLHPKQLEFTLAKEHYTAMVAGIGSGKSYAGSVRALMAAGGQIGGMHIPTPNLGIVTAPTYTMLRDSTLRTFLEIAGKAVKEFNKSEMRATLVNGSEILFRSTDNFERLRGPSILWWFGDEGALYQPGVWKIMVGRLRQHGMHGWAWLATSPRGRNWVYKRFGVPRANYRLIRAKTKDNPYLDREFIAALYEEYDGDFAKQELEGEFIAFEGLIYPEFTTASHLFTETIDTRKFKRVIAGVDWGWNNPGCILVGGVDGDGRVTIVHEEYARRKRIEQWAEIAKELRDEWKIDAFYCDPSEPDYIKKFKELGCRAYAADNRVLPGLEEVRKRLVIRHDGLPRLRVVQGAANLINEFEQYQWAENKEGLRDQPRKANDHAADSLRYLVMGVETGVSAPLETSEESYI